MWNEKGFTALKSMIDGNMDTSSADEMNKVFVNKKVGKTVICGSTVNGNHTPEDIAILLLCKFSSSIKSFFKETSFGSICFNRSGNKKNRKYKAVAAISKNN